MPNANAVMAATHASVTPTLTTERGRSVTSDRTDLQPIMSAPSSCRLRERRSGGSTGSSVSHTDVSAGSGSRTVGTAARCPSRRRRGVILAMSSPSLGGFNVPMPPLAAIPHAC
jgi:hypothetical protein